MSLRLKMIYSCLTGAWGGLLAWILLDPVLHLRMSSTVMDALVNGAVIGLCVGGLVGGFQGLLAGSMTQARRQISGGALSGLVGGASGLVIGDALYQSFNQAPFARNAGWAIFGLAIGASDGILHRAWRRILLGAIGGLLGGIVGSYAFQVITRTMAMPNFSRALGFTVLGAFIGLFIGLMPVIVSATGLIGTLKVVSGGRNEGKQILLDKQKTLIGSSELCDLALYGSQDIEARHAQIDRTAQGPQLSSLGAASVWVNGQIVNQRLLHSGDRIQIGNEEILYRKADKERE